MSIWPILALLFAIMEALAVWKGWRRVEYIAKPAVILILTAWLMLSTGLAGYAFWFGLGLMFSLLGDIVLLYPHRGMFLSGLIFFLLVHVCYILGFHEQFLNPSAWSMVVLVVILLNGVRLLRRIATAVREQGLNGLVYPIIIYGLVISFMLYAAMSTISDPDWKIGAAFLVSVGAFLFWLSDLMLSWNKFVTPLKGGRIPVIITYQLGQILLIAGVISHFS